MSDTNSEEERAELAALHHLSDDTLWTIAAEHLSQEVQQQMSSLQAAHSRSGLSPAELSILEGLVERENRLMVRKAEGAGILMERGYLFRQEDFRPSNL